jgi:hypothetical protein
VKEAYMAFNLEEIVEIYEGTVESPYIRCLLYGPPGSGKTTLMATFPKPFFLDFDRGMSVLADGNQKLAKVVPRMRFSLGTPEAFEKVCAILRAAIQGTGVFGKDGKAFGTETLALDSYTNMAEVFLDQIMRLAGKDPLKDKPTFDEWGRLKAWCALVNSLLKDLSLKMNVVMSAWSEEIQNDLTKVVRGIPDIIGSTGKRLGGDADETYYMQARRNAENKLEIVLHAAVYQGIYDAKTRVLDKLDFTNPTYEILKESMERKRKRS